MQENPNPALTLLQKEQASREQKSLSRQATCNAAFLPITYSTAFSKAQLDSHSQLDLEMSKECLILSRFAGEEELKELAEADPAKITRRSSYGCRVGERKNCGTCSSRIMTDKQNRVMCIRIALIRRQVTASPSSHILELLSCLVHACAPAGSKTKAPNPSLYKSVDHGAYLALDLRMYISLEVA